VYCTVLPDRPTTSALAEPWLGVYSLPGSGRCAVRQSTAACPGGSLRQSPAELLLWIDRQGRRHRRQRYRPDGDQRPSDLSRSVRGPGKGFHPTWEKGRCH